MVWNATAYCVQCTSVNASYVPVHVDFFKCTNVPWFNFFRYMVQVTIQCFKHLYIYRRNQIYISSQFHIVAIGKEKTCDQEVVSSNPSTKLLIKIGRIEQNWGRWCPIICKQILRCWSHRSLESSVWGNQEGRGIILPLGSTHLSAQWHPQSKDWI